MNHGGIELTVSQSVHVSVHVPCCTARSVGDPAWPTTPRRCPRQLPSPDSDVASGDVRVR